MTYQPGIPTGLIDLDVDYQNIQTNFQQLDTQFGIDHIPFSDTSGTVNGFHTSIHFNPISTTATNPPNNNPPVTPAALPGFGQLFSCELNDGISVDQSLYFLTGSGRLIPLTRNLTPAANPNGFTCLPGGLIMQWGLVTGLSGAWPTTPQVLNFATGNIDFTSNCLGVWTTFIGPTSSSSGDISINSISTTSFTWQFSGSSGASYGGFYW
ncbi:MAG: hypothetical protein ABFD00_10350, partial [Chloroherpetonaceae bacterium]